MRRYSWPSRIPWIALFLLAPISAFAGTALSVKVVDEDGLAVPNAVVSVVEIAREATTGVDGSCEFDGLRPGTYHLRARREGFGLARTEVSFSATTASKTVITLSPAVHFSESVTVAPGGRDTFESYQPTSVLGGEDLQQRLGASLGETLSTQPGVNVRSFGPGPARPVVRGLDGDRVLVLENGARTGDLSSQSADHGVTVDPATATQIEVVRGPATLLYGSNALGGVVNLISDEIPRKPLRGAQGAFTLQGGTANEEEGAAGNVSVGNGRWAFRVNGAGHHTGDVDTPEGTLPNSQSRLGSGGGALSLTGEQGYAGLSYQYVDTKYGIPFVEEGETTLNPRRHRVDFRAERRGLAGFLEGFKIEAGYRNYKHDEIEGDGTIATSFKNNFTEAQALLNHRPVGRLQGTFGLWGTYRDYSSAGEEALAPPTTQSTFAAFIYEELKFGHVAFQFGGRVDHSAFSPDVAAVPEREGIADRKFTTVSASVGALGYLRHDLTLALNLARAARNPSLEELYNFGPHAGNFAFEVGNPGLPTEVGLGLDLSLRYRRRRLALEGTLFRNRIDHFIFAFPTGEVEDDLPVVNFLSADSLLQGFELHADLGLTDTLWLEVGGDGVRAELRATDDPLPRIPPYRGWVGLRYQTRKLRLEGEARFADRQDRVYGAESETAGYAVFGAHASYTFAAGKIAHTVTLRLDNASDRLYRNHLSYIKDRAPEMGRSLKALYSVRF